MPHMDDDLRQRLRAGGPSLCWPNAVRGFGSVAARRDERVYLGGLGRDGLVFFVMDAFPSLVKGDRHFGFNLKTALTECP